MIKTGLTTRERWLQQCFLLYAGTHPLKCMKASLVLVKTNSTLRSGSPCFRDKTREVVSVFCHWRSPQLSLDSCGLPPTVLWGWLFLNKWVYDSDFLLPLPSLSLIWNSTHPSERAQSSFCLSPCFPCATWLEATGVCGGGGMSSIWKARGHTHICQGLDLCSNSPLESLLCFNEFSERLPLTVMVITTLQRIFKEYHKGSTYVWKLKGGCLYGLCFVELQLMNSFLIQMCARVQAKTKQ